MAEGELFQVTAQQLLPGDVVAVNVFYVHQLSAEPSDDADVVADLVDWVEDLFNAISGVVHEEITPLEAEIRRWDFILESWEAVGSDVPNIITSAVGDLLPQGVAPVLRALTAFGKVIARKFIPGMMEANVDEGVAIPALITALLLFVDEWLDGPQQGAGTWSPGTYSTSKAAFAPFTGTAVVNAIMGYQRRRKPGVGM